MFITFYKILTQQISFNNTAYVFKAFGIGSVL